LTSCFAGSFAGSLAGSFAGTGGIFFGVTMIFSPDGGGVIMDGAPDRVDGAQALPTQPVPQLPQLVPPSQQPRSLWWNMARRRAQKPCFSVSQQLLQVLQLSWHFDL